MNIPKLVFLLTFFSGLTYFALSSVFEQRDESERLLVWEQEADQAIAESYAIWKRDYVVSTEEGLRRVVRVESENDTVSEGIAYGMLLAAYLKDQSLLDDLWGYAQLYLDDRGLMHWRIHADGTIWEFNAATDADQDMAIALLVAHRNFGQESYQRAAQTLIQNIWNFEVEHSTNVLKPGDVWGGSEVTNPSYFAPAYYRVFANVTGNPGWILVADRSYQILAEINKLNQQTGLVPDWATANGTKAEDEDLAYYYGFDACRMPWRLAHDVLWFGDHRARDHLYLLNAFWALVGPDNISDGYSLTGTQPGPNLNTATFTTMAASGAVVADDYFRAAMWRAGREAWNDNYYSRTLHVLGLLTASGRMVNPLSI
jgi:endo-1,4-beta-D-glucanase Y